MEKDLAIGDSKVRVVVEMHPSSRLRDFVQLLTQGDVNYMMSCMDWLRRRKLNLESFPTYLFDRIIETAVESVKSNRRFVTSSDMKVSIIVNAPPSSVDAVQDSYLDSFGLYYREESGPSHAVIALFFNHRLFSNIIERKNFDLIREVITHELQHHAGMGFGEMMYRIQKRRDEMMGLGRLSYNGWVAILACLELKSEGLSKFSEYVKEGCFVLSFSSMENFVRFFARIPCLDNKSLIEEYGPIRNKSYFAGMMMVATILAQRLALKGIPTHIKPRDSNWMHLTKLRYYYGVTDFYLACLPAAKYRKIAGNEAKKLLSELQNTSHITFLTTYEAACQYLGVKPLFTIKLYSSVKLQCHLNFLQRLSQKGLTASVA